MTHTSVYNEIKAMREQVYLRTIELVAQWLVETGHADLVEPLIAEFTVETEQPAGGAKK